MVISRWNDRYHHDHLIIMLKIRRLKTSIYVCAKWLFCLCLFRSCSRHMETSRDLCMACSSTPLMSPRTCCSRNASRRSLWAQPMSMTFQKCSDRYSKNKLFLDYLEIVTNKSFYSISFHFPGSKEALALKPGLCPLTQMPSSLWAAHLHRAGSWRPRSAGSDESTARWQRGLFFSCFIHEYRYWK